MKTFNNVETNMWIEDLTEDNTLRKYLPMTSFSLVNNGSLPVKIWLHSVYVGECQGYSGFNLIGKPYENFKIFNKDNESLNSDSIEVTVGTAETITNMAYNPQTDLMEENLDKFASGCTSRINYSTAYTTEMIKYWININLGLIVQRRLEIEGSVNMGQYSITFGSDDILSGSVGVWMIANQEKRFKKTVVNREFDYSVSNCVISGWMIDYNKKANDQMDNGVGGESQIKDDNMSTYYQYLATTTMTTYDIITIPECNISEVNLGVTMLSDSTHTLTCRIELKVNSVWTTIGDIAERPTVYTWYTGYYTGNWEKVTGMRLRGQTETGFTNRHIRTHDVSLF